MSSAAKLTSTVNFGKPNLNHQFNSEVVMEHTLLPLFKSGNLHKEHNGVPTTISSSPCLAV
eukprot:13221163-Ditylum_brightwellii.AAC.1